MDWHQIPAGQLHAAEQRWRGALGDDADAVFEYMRLNNQFCQKAAKMVTQLMKDERMETFMAGWSEARKIMGQNFLGVKDAIRHFNVDPTADQLTALATIPFSKAVLQRCKNTHVLVAVFLSIPEILRSVQAKKLFCGEGWHFLKQKEDKVCWQLVSKIEILDSTRRNWAGQQALLDEDETVPTAQAMIHTIIGYCLNTEERLFNRLFVRTSSVLPSGDRICIGRFNSEGLNVRVRCDLVRGYHLGVASCQKPQ